MAPPSSSVAVASERRGGALMHGRTRRGRRSKRAEAEMAPAMLARLLYCSGGAACPRLTLVHVHACTCAVWFRCSSELLWIRAARSPTLAPAR